jgi:ankyrin repeat protein
MLAPERQLALLMQDSAGFVNRGLALLWRDRVQGDLSGEHERARGLIEANDLAALARLLRDQPALLEYRMPDADGFQLLHWAARCGTPAALGLLLEHGAPLDAPNGHLAEDGSRFLPGATPLLVACEAGCEDLALALLEAGADADARVPGGGETALHLAAGQGMALLLEALIGAGADLDAMSPRLSYDDQLGNFSGNTPLHAAALGDCGASAYQLLKAGAARDAAGDDCRTALHYAAARGAVGVLEVLLAAGADPDAPEACSLDGAVITGLSPLHYAVVNGHEVAAQMLLCYGADPRRVEPASGETALQMAERSENPHLAALLARAAAGEASGPMLSFLDEQFITCLPESYAEMLPFLDNLLSEFPLGQKSLLILSDWLAEMLGPENRPHLARASRELAASQGE